jgi:hypothetical protein
MRLLTLGEAASQAEHSADDIPEDERPLSPVQVCKPSKEDEETSLVLLLATVEQRRAKTRTELSVYADTIHWSWFSWICSASPIRGSAIDDAVEFAV